MQIHKITLIASLFAFGCGEKSDEDNDDSWSDGGSADSWSDAERLDALVEGCESLKEAWNELADSCDGFDRSYIDCEEQVDLTEEHGCLDEAEAALECLEGIGYDTLPCEESSLDALATCQADSAAFNACIGEGTL